VAQQREHPRYAHEAAVTVVAGNASITGHTTNLSRGGLCASLAEAVAVGSNIDVDIVLVFEGDVRSEPLRLPARVVWCTHVDDGHQIGISFRPLDAELAEYLGLFIKYLGEGAVPKERTKRDLPVDDRFR
jgi:hypothetical protein